MPGLYHRRGGGAVRAGPSLGRGGRAKGKRVQVGGAELFGAKGGEGGQQHQVGLNHPWGWGVHGQGRGRYQQPGPVPGLSHSGSARVGPWGSHTAGVSVRGASVPQQHPGVALV